MPVPALDDPFQLGEVLGLLEGADGVGELGAEAGLLLGAALWASSSMTRRRRVSRSTPVTCQRSAL